MVQAIMCPQCNAPLKPHRFAQWVVCSYCGATVKLDEASVSAARFHQTYRTWNSPTSYPISSWISINDNHWALESCIARGDISDVYTGARARWPTELVLVKILRDRKDIALFENEWKALQSLQHSNAPGADTLATLLPQPVMHGDISAGSFAGARVSIYRWAAGFIHTVEDVMRFYPQGIPARASIWVWRRILEVLSFIHASGMVHGAVLPSHLLVQENEHGVRLVSYSAAGHTGERLQVISPEFDSFYPPFIQNSPRLSAQLDLIMSARCMVAVLGGDPVTGSLPSTVPASLAGMIKRVALVDSGHALKQDAWMLRDELGRIATEIYGPPQFIPIILPS